MVLRPKMACDEILTVILTTLIRVRRRLRFSLHSHRANHSKPRAQVY